MKSPVLFMLISLFTVVSPFAHAAEADGVKAERDIAYVAGGHARQKLDLFLPETAGGPWPLIVWVHGGAWFGGSKDECPPLRKGFVERGYAVASIDYRFSSDAIFPAQIEDCKAAIRWLRAHAKEYHLDPERFGAWGSSAGGHLVALLGTSGGERKFETAANPDVTSRVQAVCDFFGPIDVLQMDAHALPGARLKHDPPSSPESRLIGGPIQENPEKAAAANPITYITADAPPFLIVHGGEDPLVPIHQSRLLFDALKSAGANVHLHKIRGAGHGQGFEGAHIDSMVNKFFDSNLKGPPGPREAVLTESLAPGLGAEATRPRAFAGPDGGPRGWIPWEAVITRDDKDKDGKVSRQEFSGPPPMFDRVDRDRDGSITKEEHENAFGPPPPPRRGP